MNAGQKATKYIGMFIGVLLAICIIGAIARAGLELIRVFTGGSNESIAEFAEDYDEKITSLDLRNDLGEVRLVAGDTWRVEASDVSKSFKSQVTGGKLVICNDSKNWFSLFHWGNRSPRVTVYMPEEELDSILLDTGAGAVYADAKLNARSVRINGGAGEIRLSAVKAGKLNIDLGVGKTDVQGDDVGDLDLDGGEGAF